MLVVFLVLLLSLIVAVLICINILYFFCEQSFNFFGMVWISPFDRAHLSSDELVFVVAHEKGHSAQYLAGEWFCMGHDEMRRREAFAEAFAIREMVEKGYSLESIRDFELNIYSLHKYGQRWANVVVMSK